MDHVEMKTLTIGGTVYEVVDEQARNDIADFKTSSGGSGTPGATGENGATFTPSVSENGDLSWTNDKGLTNPTTVNIRGPQGLTGGKGADGNGIKSAILNADYTLTLTFDDGTTYTTPSIRGATGAAGKNGANGSAGADGVGIASIKQTTTSTADGGENVFTVTLTNGTSATFTVKNGSKGSTGATGGVGPQGPKGDPYTLTEADKAEIAAAVIESLGGNPVFGYVDSNNNIVVSGNLPDGTYIVKYEMEDGSTLEIGNLVLSDDNTISYTNLADPTSADWQEDYRLSLSGGNTSALAGHIVTNYIPCKMGDVLRVKGFNIIGTLSTNGTGVQNDAKILSFDVDKGKLAGAYGAKSTTSSQYICYGEAVTVDGDISTYIIMMDNAGNQLATASTAFIRIDGALMDGYTKNDVIITINEKIV